MDLNKLLHKSQYKTNDPSIMCSAIPSISQNVKVSLFSRQLNKKVSISKFRVHLTKLENKLHQ